MRRSERIHLPCAPETARQVTYEALGLDADGGGRLAGSPQSSVTVQVEADGGSSASVVTVVAENVTRLPFFGWFYGPIFRFELRRGLRWSRAAVEAAAAGTAAPEPLGAHPFSTPGNFDTEQSNLIATVAFAGALTAFAAALFGQFGDPIAKSFHESDGNLASAFAITRVGAVIALVAATLADRYGRRRILLGSLVGLSLASAVSAVAPNFGVLIASQSVVRACVNAALIVGGIAVVEEAPEGARAFAVSMLALAAGAGYALSVILLPIADLGRESWRIAFGVSALSVVLVPSVARHLKETSRFRALADRTEERGRLRELFDRAYGRRLFLLAAVGFLSNIFSAPSAQLSNRYLGHQRGYSSSGIAQFKAVTTGIPGLIGILLAGRLTESRGRRPVAIIGVLAGTLLTVVFYLGTGPLIWVASSFGVIAAASGSLSVGTMDAELFPTEVRGTANAFLLVTGVAGSVVGLLLAGLLSDQLHDLGLAIALCGVAPILAATFLIRRLPESSGRTLDDVSPSEV